MQIRSLSARPRPRPHRPLCPSNARHPPSNGGCSNHSISSRIAANAERVMPYRLPGLSPFLMEQTIQMRQVSITIFWVQVATSYCRSLGTGKSFLFVRLHQSPLEVVHVLRNTRRCVCRSSALPVDARYRKANPGTTDASRLHGSPIPGRPLLRPRRSCAQDQRRP